MAGQPRTRADKANAWRAIEPAHPYTWEPNPKVVYTDEILTDALAQVGGGKSLREVCRENRYCIQTVIRHLLSDKWREHYTCAKNSRAHVLAEKINELAEMAVRGEVATDAARVAIDAHKWTLARILRNEYGDKQEIISSQADHETDLDAIAPAPAPPPRKKKKDDPYKGMLQ